MAGDHAAPRSGAGEGSFGGPRSSSRRGDDDADTQTVDIPQPHLPSYHIEDEPTVVFGGRLPQPRAAQLDRGPESAGSPPSHEGRDDRAADDPAFTNVFLNVGRRDGLRAEDVQRLLIDKAGLTESDVGHIRLRDRITFVGIRKEHSDRAIKALIGVVVGDRTVNAEPAREAR
jgi:ATP-dependent RNA helicase DeaD